MDPLRRHDLEVARATSPEDKAVQALEAMQLGIDLKRASLRARHLELSDEAIDELLFDWLAGDDD